MAIYRERAEPPTFTPLPFGLLSTLGTETRSPRSSHWQLGVTYDAVCALGGTTYDECFAVSGTGSAAVAPPAPKAETTTVEHRGATAFTVFSRVDCSAPGFWDEANELGRRALTQSEQYQVERAFWTGLAGNALVVFPHLAANAEVTDESGVVLQTAAISVVSGSAALDVVEGIGRLEGALAACYDGVGVLHVPRSLGAALASEGLLIREGPRYRTPTGNIVVLGAGYPGTSPSGDSSNQSVWVYATGAVFLYKGAMEVVPTRAALDRATNAVSTLAERTFLLGWDCCHFAVNITLGGSVAGAALAGG